MRLAESIGLDICPLCSLQDIPSVLQDDSPKVVFHSFLGTTGCVETPVCRCCFDAGLGEPPEEEEPGAHITCQNCYLCAIQGCFFDEQTGEAHPFTCACYEREQPDYD